MRARARRVERGRIATMRPRFPGPGRCAVAPVNGPAQSEVIAIIGGGFCGTMVAFHLARLARPNSLRVVLIEKGPQFARGLAYGTSCDRHLLNVPAGLMSALPEEPSHFLDWLKTKDPAAQ